MIHSPYGPSALAAIRLCPGRVRMCKQAAARTTEEAQRGDNDHAFAAHVLRESLVLEQLRGLTVGINEDEDVREVTVDDNMINTVRPYVTRCKELITADPGAWYGIEQTLDLSWIHPEMFGTPDFAMISTQRFGYIWDLKGGVGEYVDEKGNDQTMAYGAALMGPDNERQLTGLELGISQPNSYVDAPANRSAVVTPEQMAAWVADIREVIARAEDPNAPCIPGKKQCQFCDANPCPACEAEIMDLVPTGPTDPQVTELTGAQLARFMELIPVINKTIKNVQKEVRRRWDTNHPDKAPGYELAHGKKVRKWSEDDEAVVAVLEMWLPSSEIYTPQKLKTVAQIENALKAAQLDPGIVADLIAVTRGLTMKPVSDKNIKPLPDVNEMFKEG